MCETIKEIIELKNEAILEYVKHFNIEPKVKAFAPGRVNLIGEHTDYNDGFVMPLSLSMGTVIVGGLNNSTNCYVRTMSAELSETNFIEFDIYNLNKSTLKWANYLIGVLNYFKASNKTGFNAIINSSVPLGSGLSSSAALEVAFYVFLEGIYETESLSLLEKALICQQSEHNYADVPCGLMDQLISVMGKKSHCLFIDCRDVSLSKFAPLDDDSISILIINSNVKHDLGSSEYPLRRQYCKNAALKMNKTSLRDVTIADLETKKNHLDPIEFKRAKHVITENDRVTAAFVKLQKSDYITVGKLMNESHASLRDDFEVSCNEIDEIVEITQGINGVFGSRITGGGFGGCTVTLLNNSAINDVINEVKKNFNGTASFYLCSASDGARFL